MDVVAALPAELLGVLEPEEAELGQRVNTSLGNQRASSHSIACGRSSFATNRRIASRNCSCSSPNGGIGLRAAASGSPFSASAFTQSSGRSWTTDCYVITLRVDSTYLQRLLDWSARDAAHSACKEAERHGWQLDRLTDFQARYLHKYALLEVAMWASERQLLHEFAQAGDRVDEVFRALRPESLALREQLRRAKP